jgi:hypothetical protein
MTIEKRRPEKHSVCLTYIESNSEQIKEANTHVEINLRIVR